MAPAAAPTRCFFDMTIGGEPGELQGPVFDLTQYLVPPVLLYRSAYTYLHNMARSRESLPFNHFFVTAAKQTPLLAAAKQ